MENQEIKEEKPIFYGKPLNSGSIYDNMTLDEILSSPRLDLEVFENTRRFQPRKHRTCHRLPPDAISPLRRKENLCKTSRDYVRRNHDEIEMCQRIYSEITAKKDRLQKLVALLQFEVEERKIRHSIANFHSLMDSYCEKGFAMLIKDLETPSLEEFLENYKKEAESCMEIVFDPSNSSYPFSSKFEQEYRELLIKMEDHERKKDDPNFRETSNFASTKCRLKQRITRAELKFNCYSAWIATETLLLQGAELRRLSEFYKGQIWTEILQIWYHHLINLDSIKDSQDGTGIVCLMEATREFLPFMGNFMTSE